MLLLWTRYSFLLDSNLPKILYVLKGYSIPSLKFLLYKSEDSSFKSQVRETLRSSGGHEATEMPSNYCC